jgi:hypothetical protein
MGKSSLKKRDPKLATLKSDIGDAQGDIEYLKSEYIFMLPCCY